MRRDRSARPWHLYALGLLAVVVAVLAALEVGPPSSSARTSRELVTAENGIVQSSVTGTGNVEPGTDVDTNFVTSGTLQHVYVKTGQHVTKGQLLATLDPTSAQLSLDQAEENLTSAEDQLTSAEDGTATDPSSSSTSAGGTSAGSDATSSSTSSAASIASAQASVDGDQASVHSAEQALSETKLDAPTSGTIVSMADLVSGDSVSAGSTTSSATSSSSSSNSSSSSSLSGGSSTAGSLGSSGSSSTSSSSSSSPFAEIVNSGTMTMTVSFSESDISKVHVGQPATITLDALSGVELAAHVTQISDMGTSSDGVVSYNATLTINQHNSEVKPGMSASAAVIVGQAQGVTVPNAAVTGTGSLGTVNVLENKKTVAKQVVVGLKGDSRTQIVSGLNAGQQLVVTITLPSLSTSSSSTGSSTLGGAGLRGLGGAGFFGGGGGLFGGGAGAFLRRGGG